MNALYALETKVPHFGRIKAVKCGEMEYEYLLLKAGVTSWLSHSDIEAMFEANSMNILQPSVTDKET